MVHNPQNLLCDHHTNFGTTQWRQWITGTSRIYWWGYLPHLRDSQSQH